MFSAAIPLQGGQNHINEQWNDYWIEKFSAEGYTCLDFLKPYFWDNDQIFWWYKQNILFFTKEPQRFSNYEMNKLNNVIHPDLFKIKTEELELLRKKNVDENDLIQGGKPFIFYFEAIARKIRRKLIRK